MRGEKNVTYLRNIDSVSLRIAVLFTGIDTQMPVLHARNAETRYATGLITKKRNKCFVFLHTFVCLGVEKSGENRDKKMNQIDNPIYSYLLYSTVLLLFAIVVLLRIRRHYLRKAYYKNCDLSARQTYFIELFLGGRRWTAREIAGREVSRGRRITISSVMADFQTLESTGILERFSKSEPDRYRISSLGKGYGRYAGLSDTL